MQRTVFLLIILFASVCAMADEFPRTISVTGTGTSSAAPDGAVVRMSIVVRKPKLDVAQAAAGKVAAGVLSLTDKLKIDRGRIDTTGAVVRPDYRWNRETEEQELRGYIAERQMTVLVKDLELLGRLVEGAVDVGVNQVSPPELQSSSMDAANRKALSIAASDAKANAEVLAESLGASIGKVISINAGRNAPMPPGPQMRMAAAAESDAAASYNSGDLTFSATVSVVFELTD